MSLDKTDCLQVAQDLLANLNSWKEESHRQISRIINSQSTSINTGINTLVEEVRGLQNELSLIRKEKAVLLETVDNLNGEISQLNTRLQPLPKPKEETDQEIVEAANHDEEMLEVTQQGRKSDMLLVLSRFLKVSKGIS